MGSVCGCYVRIKIRIYHTRISSRHINIFETLRVIIRLFFYLHDVFNLITCMGIWQTHRRIYTNAVNQVIKCDRILDRQASGYTFFAMKSQRHASSNLHSQRIWVLNTWVIVWITRIIMIEIASHPARIIILVIISTHHPNISATKMRSIHIFI